MPSYAATALSGTPMAEQDFAFIVAGGIVAMLPGRSMASAIEDVLFGFPLTGAGRLLSVLVSLMGLIIGIAGGADRDAVAHHDAGVGLRVAVGAQAAGRTSRRWSRPWVVRSSSG